VSVRFSTADRQNVVQQAYHVADIDAAIARWHELLGIGPFLVRRHIQLEQVRYRGAASTLDISAAHAQAGDVQIELVQQHCDSPSAFRDMFSPEDEGLHHVALFPDDYETMVAHYNHLGHSTATELITGEGRGAAFIDTRAVLGHMVEIYRPNDSLVRFYEQIEEASLNWDRRALAIEV